MAHMQRFRLVFAMIAVFVTAQVASAATPWNVSGTIEGQFIVAHPGQTPHGALVEGADLWDGDLSGSGIGHVFGSEPYSKGPRGDATASRTLYTSVGNLFFYETSDLSQFPLVSAVAIVRLGTGVFKGATGVLYLEGEVGGGQTSFSYAGTIYLAD